MASARELNLEATHRLGPRAFFLFWSRRARWTLLALLCVIVAWVFREKMPFVAAYHVQAEIVFQIVFAVTGALFLMTSLRAFFEYRSYEYRFEREFFRLTRGYIARQEIGVVYHQIQTVTLNHNFFDRMTGISHLVIVMTGTHDAPSEVVLPALDRRKARQVQEELLRQARIRSGLQQSAAPLNEAELWR